MHKFIVLSFLQVLLILSIGCKTSYTPLQSQFDLVKVRADGDTLTPLITERFLKPYRQQLQDSFSTVLAFATSDFVKRRPGGSLGNLVTAAIENYELNIKNIEDPTLILMNFGGIRLNEISKGDITVGKIYELLPFENTMVRIQINGAQLVKLIEEINKSGGWPIRFVRNDKLEAPIGQLDGYNAFQKSRTLNKEFILITNNYLAQGGDNCSILKTLPQEDTGILLRDIVIDYLKKEKTITPDNTDYILK